MNSFLRNCIVTLFFTLVSITSVYAQPPNDDRCSPTPLGILGAPAVCAAGATGVNVGATTTLTNQTTVAATSGNPYQSLIGCTGGIDMASPALDTWYTFIPSGNSVTINITGFASANLGIWTGINCSNLSGVACTVLPAGGTGSLIIPSVVIGQTYYLQISGNTSTATDNNFSIAINNSIDCNSCLTASSFSATPTPSSGVYSPGQVVRFCYTVSNFDQISTNWFHGVQITWGPGWTGAITNTTVPAACQGSGTWAYFPGTITSTFTGLPWGTGFYFDSTDTGTNPGNNYGDNCVAYNWTFCWDMTVSAACIAGQDLSVTVNTSGDGESGSWSSNACNDDLPSKLLAIKSANVTMTNPNTATICSGATLNFPLTTSSAATITWIATSNPNVTGESTTLQTSNNIINTLVNTSAVAQIVTYTATPTTSSGCAGIPQTISITVLPTPTANAGTGSTICAGSGSCVNLSGSVTNAASSVGPISFSNNSSYAIPDNSTAGVSSPIVVSGITPSVIGAGSIASVCININHTFDADLDIFLESPDGTRIILSTDNGGSNDNYTGTCFSPTAVTAITAGAANAPFTGSFLPEGLFSALNTLLINGTWKLFVKDDTGGDIGNIVGWTITFNNNAPAFSWSPTTAMTNSTTLTPTVCPTVTTTYTLTANGAAGCGTATSPVTVTVTTVNTVGAASATPTLCINTALTAITHATTGATGIGTATGLPLGVTAAWATNTITISGTPTVSGTYNYTIPLTGGCGTVNATGTITVNPIVTPSISCGTSTINSVQFIWQAVANATGYSVSYQIWAGAFNPGTPILTGTTYTLDVTGLTSGATVTIRVTPTGPAGTCFGQSSIACPAVVCPTILTPTASQSLCINGTPTPISVNTTFTAANSIKFVYFNLPQSGTTMYTYTLANLLSDATPAATGVASYTLPALGVAGSLPNVAAIYYVYAIANPTPTDPGCRPYQLIQITVNPLHTLTLSSAVATETQTTCAGTAITDITYTLGGGATSASVTGLPTGVTFLVSGTILTISGTPTTSAVLPFGYSITTSGNGCTVATDSGTITVNPLHTLTLSSAVATETQTTCAGTAITDITYTLGGGATGATVTGLPTGVTFLVSGTILTISGIPTASAVLLFGYSITTSGNTCTPFATDSGTITVNPVPTIIATPTTETLCSLQSTGISLSSSIPTATFSWTISSTGATGATAGSGNAISQVLTATGTVVETVVYTATSFANGCFSTPINIPILVTPKPTAIATPSLQSICSGNAPNIVLTGTTPGTTFTWNSVTTNVNGASSGTTAIISQPLTTMGGVIGEAVYSITPLLNGCPGLPILVTINVNPIPVISANPMNAIICSGETTAIDLTSSVPGTTYSWSVLQTGLFGTASGSGSQINQTLTTVGLVSGNVVYIITPMVNGCAGIPIRVTVLVNPTPELFGSPTQLPICSGEDTQIILTPNIIGTTFAWTATQNGVTGAFDGTGGSIIQTLETTGTTFGIASYDVTPTLNSCVGNTITISVRVNPLPTPTLLDGIICEDLAGNLLNPYLLNTGLGISNLEFEWYFNGVIILGEVGNTLSAEESGIYSVQVKNLTTGCISLQTATSATVTPKNPGLSLVAEASIAFSDDASIIATVTGGSGDFEYSLDNGPFQTSNIFTPVEPGTHIVVVRDINGCTNLTASALVIGYPTYFTPNGDSYHDYWNIIGFDLTNNAKIYIFDRYGKLIKQINPLGQGWDGTYNETPMPSTDYWFTTDYYDAVENKNKVFKSHFSLKR
ncbi:Gliding motility-associated, C-terminal domain [Flavobacteriaceae bacterium]